ncbi:MAG: glycosyltransferase family 4 protein [Gemmatimonadales bacterium]
MADLPVACVSVSAALGGSERVLLDFASRARGLGIEPIVILPKTGLLVDVLKESGAQVRIAPAAPDFLELSQRATLSASGLAQFAWGLARWSREIAQALEHAEAALPRRAILYSNGFKAHLACTLVRGRRHVWHLHEFPPDGLAPAWRLLAGALPDAAIANSRSVADAWRIAHFPPPAVVLNGVDTQRFAPASPNRWIHELLDLPKDARLIGMPAVFARWKGHLLVIEAFERAAAEIPDAHLVLVGGPIYDTVAERGYAEELVRRVGRASLGGTEQAARSLTDRIHFVKFQSEPWRLYPEFDLVVHFSTRAEPFGRVVVEAMACGVPVVAAHAGGPAEIVEDGVTGWLIEPGDVTALSRRMVDALQSDASAVRRAARAVAESRFSADRFAREVAEVLKRVVP